MIDFTKVFPRLKETYKEDAPAELHIGEGKTMELPHEDSPVMKPFAQNLTISYAIDMARTISSFLTGIYRTK